MKKYRRTPFPGRSASRERIDKWMARENERLEAEGSRWRIGRSSHDAICLLGAPVKAGGDQPSRPPRKKTAGGALSA